MAAFEQTKYCPSCKKGTSANENDLCRICGNKVTKGLWSARFRIMTLQGENQKRLSGFNTKREAKQAYLDFITTYKPLSISDTKTFIFDDLWAKYILNCQTENSDSTIYEKKFTFARFIKPVFKGRDITKITKADLLNWQNFVWNQTNPKTKTKYSWKYLTKIRGTMFNFLSYCETIYDVPNMYRTIKTPKNLTTKKEIVFWELPMFDEFIKTEKDIMYRTLWYTFMYTGARFNEIRALNDSDIVDNKIQITKSLCKKAFNPESPTKPTKNYKIVKKQIPDILTEQISIYKKWKKTNNIPGNYLFGGKIPLSENDIRRNLREAIALAKVKYITPHGFRHSYVSLLIHLGVSTKVIAELIGDREEQVIKTYGHLYANAKDDAISLLNTKILK